MEINLNEKKIGSKTSMVKAQEPGDFFAWYDAYLFPEHHGIELFSQGIESYGSAKAA